MICIVDYGLGNVRAFLNVYESINIPACAATSEQILSKADKIILPGVGSFDQAMELLQASGMREILDDLVLKKNIPILGVCVGMQLLGTKSEEGDREGLNWIPGTVRKFSNKNNSTIQLPHMGWNDVCPTEKSELFIDLEQNSKFYFLHSFHFECANAEHSLAETEYGDKFTCAVRKNNIFGVQFHPEKSHDYGSVLLKNFSRV